MDPELRPPLVAIPSVRDTAHTFAAHGSSVMRPLLQVSVWLSQTAQTTCDLTFRASPLRGIAPSRVHVGSSAFLALLLLITCTSPSSRQRILGITPGLGFLRNPSPYAMRLAPAPVVSRRGRTGLLRSQFPWFASVGRCSPPGFCGSANRSVWKAAGALSCAVLAPARQPLALVGIHDGSMHLCLRCP